MLSFLILPHLVPPTLNMVVLTKTRDRHLINRILITGDLTPAPVRIYLPDLVEIKEGVGGEMQVLPNLMRTADYRSRKPPPLVPHQLVLSSNHPPDRLQAGVGEGLCRINMTLSLPGEA